MLCKLKLWMDPLVEFFEDNEMACFQDYLQNPTCTCNDDDKETISLHTLILGGSWASDVGVEVNHDVANLVDVASDLENSE